MEKEEDISNKSCYKKEAESIPPNFDEPDLSGTLFNKIMAKQNLSSHNKSFCRSWFESSIIEYTWDIDRVMTYLQITKELSSLEFPETGQYQIKLSIDINTLDKLKSKVRFYLLTKKEFMGKCEISFAHHYETTCENIHWSPYIGTMTNMTLLCEIALGFFGEDIISKDKIIINFKFEILDRFHAQTIHMNIPTNIICKNFNYERESDVNMGTNDKVKSIVFLINKDHYSIPMTLLRRINSTYFNNICDMYENDENMKMPYKIKVDDSNMLAFKRMLIFILSGSLTTSYNYDQLRNLLIVAHKYDVETLKLICEQYLLRKLNIHNSVDLIMLAISCNAKILEEKIAIFIKFYLKEIFQDKKFYNLSQENVDKIFDLIDEINIPLKSQVYNHLEI